MVVKKVWLIPVAASLCGFTAILSSYIVGAVNGHFPAILPFISDVGAKPPEDCLFSQFLNAGSFFIIITCYIRHRQTVEYYGHRLQWESSRWRKISLFFMCVGMLMAVSMTVVANFPESEAFVVHGIGAAVAFLTALVYCWGQVLIGHFMVPRMASAWINLVRLFLSLVATIALILHEVTIAFGPFGPKEPAGDPYQIKWWGPKNPYFTNYVVATGSEWAMVLAVLLFVLSLAAELRFAYAHAPRVVFRRTSTELQQQSFVQVATTSGMQPSSDW